MLDFWHYALFPYMRSDFAYKNKKEDTSTQLPRSVLNIIKDVQEVSSGITIAQTFVESKEKIFYFTAWMKRFQNQERMTKIKLYIPARAGIILPQVITML